MTAHFKLVTRKSDIKCGLEKGVTDEAEEFPKHHPAL
jgi:hypothetical protein